MTMAPDMAEAADEIFAELSPICDGQPVGAIAAAFGRIFGAVTTDDDRLADLAEAVWHHAILTAGRCTCGECGSRTTIN